MNAETQSLVDLLRAQLASMAENERIEVVGAILAGYCQYCGGELHNGRCYCRCDE